MSEYIFPSFDPGEYKDALRCYRWPAFLVEGGPYPDLSSEPLRFLQGPSGGIWFLSSDYESLDFGSLEEVQRRAQVCGLCCMFMQVVPMQYGLDMKGFRIMTSEDKPHIGDFCISVEVLDDRSLSVFYFDALENVTPEDRHLLNSEPEPEVNWEVVSSWLYDCRSNHEHPVVHGRMTVDANPVANFRVIDTVRGCVAMAPESCEYAALSYVWGKATEIDMAATRTTISMLEADGFLFDNPQPLTIRDAITAYGKLGIHYLWIDRLCIIQDTEEKLAQINAMDAIYSRSTVTLVALAGIDANHGLPGVSKRRYKWPVFETQGLGIAKQRVMYHSALDYSKWNTRGWTFQEAVLSPRLLFFSDHGVFFECCHDSTIQNENASLLPVQLLYGEKSMQSIHHNGTRLVEQYTRRCLTYETDILHAISGVLNAKCGPYHHFGLSLHDFDRMICWENTSGWTPRVQPRDGPLFPSWSGCSKEGQAEYYIKDYEIAAPFALWALVTSKSEEQSLRFFQYENRDGWRSWDDHSAQGGAIAMLYAWREGCYPGELPPALNFHGTWEQIRDHLKSAMPFYDLCKAAHGLGDDRTNRYFPPSTISLASKPGRLLLYPVPSTPIKHTKGPRKRRLLAMQ